MFRFSKSDKADIRKGVAHFCAIFGVNKTKTRKAQAIASKLVTAIEECAADTIALFPDAASFSISEFDLSDTVTVPAAGETPRLGHGVKVPCDGSGSKDGDICDACEGKPDSNTECKDAQLRLRTERLNSREVASEETAPDVQEG